ncbi:methionyl-tRNA synthetase [Theileria orientalis strain Shintoku]|uniref:methionine--tRNA ligase n=1 Tax=Theileria orientalis strain Shintoku TaxID=869250 RepID=J4C426_THEOR|nr:methionyl-tRNA synthetase [Theileria orientalis strain Shintoku]BAM41451.1 methionyl-tRNA synthetase [Theileria orientalis strain Shintoku]|eukprot:XP_009691752.1 methionyl-tRNA synthetase [Theileria orientalis strain Shintoku]
MEYHLLILNKSNESLLCRNFIKIWASSAPVVSLFSSKIPEDLSDIHIDSDDHDTFKDSTSEANSYKYQQLYNELNRLCTLSQQDFSIIHTNLFKYLKRALFRPLLLLFKKDNEFVPNIVFNLKPILLYYYPSLRKVSDTQKEDKELLYWYTEFHSNFNYVGTNRKLVELLDDLEENLSRYNLESPLTQLLLSTLNMYIDGLLFRNIALSKYTNILRQATHHKHLLKNSLLNKFNYQGTATVSATGILSPSIPTSLSGFKGSDKANGASKGKSESAKSPLKGSGKGAESSSVYNMGSGKEGKEDAEKEWEPGLERDDDLEEDEKLSLNDYKKLFLENKKPYHLASAIAYTNGYPHVGHAYEAVLCDVISRFYKVFGRRVIFSTGTDEHGIKVMTTAKQQNKTPIELCDYYSNHFKILYKKLLVNYDRFIRTTSEAHIKAAKSIWKRVHSKGDIYLGKYNGYYSVREERFIPNTEAKLTDYKDPVSHKPYDLMSESSYFFTMDKYRSQLVNYITTNADFIAPAKCRNEILARLKEPLEDLSISRTSFDWGIHVPSMSTDVDASTEDYYNADVNLGYNEDNKIFNESKYYNLVNRESVTKKAHTEDGVYSGASSSVAGTANTSTVHKVGSHQGTGSSNSSAHHGTGSSNSSADANTTSTKVDGDANTSHKVGGDANTTSSNSSANGGASASASSKNSPDKSAASEAEGKTKEGAKLVPEEPKEKHVMYVWFDALSFYMTASGLGECFSEMTLWPTDLQIIGKDICWFQSVILATMCLSMQLPLTRRIVAHGFIQGPDGRKMSKSLGNVLNLEELLADTGPEPFRYYLIKSTVLGQDVNFDTAQLKELYNSDLADNVGNLVHRITNLTHKYNASVVPAYGAKVEYPFDYPEFVKLACNYVLKLDLYNLLILVNAKFRELNNYLTVKSPWAEPSADKRDSVLRILLESVYFLGHMLYPVLPESSDELFRKLGTPRRSNIWELSLGLDNLEEGSRVSVGEVLYPKFPAEPAK